VVRKPREGEDPADYPSKPGRQSRASDRRTQLVSCGLAHLLPLCRVQGGTDSHGRVDTAETALLSPQTMQEGFDNRSFPSATRCFTVPRASRGLVRKGLVATLTDSTGSSGHLRRLVRNQRSCIAGPQISLVTPLGETAVYIQVRTVVWEDGAVRPLLPDPSVMVKGLFSAPC